MYYKIYLYICTCIYRNKMIDRSMKPANANEYPQNACGVFVSTLNINQLPPPHTHTHKKSDNTETPQIINFPLYIVHYPLSIVHYPLSIVHYPLSIINFKYHEKNLLSYLSDFPLLGSIFAGYYSPLYGAAKRNKLLPVGQG